MIPFIQKVNLTSNWKKVLEELNQLIGSNTTNWKPHNQIGLRHRPGSNDQWKDSAGSLADSVTHIALATEADFSKWNDDCPAYTCSIVEQLADIEKFKIGRVRYMLANPKTGLSMHIDKEVRYHLVLETNPHAIFGECFQNMNLRSICYHLPVNGSWYKIDTTREHFIYNGGWHPRIHLVVCPA